MRDCKTRKVIQHAEYIELSDIELKVSQAGRQRVLKERRKNVHAGLQGEHLFSCTCPIMESNWEKYGAKPVTYNPYKYDSFVFCDTLQSVSFANKAWMKASPKPEVYVLV